MKRITSLSIELKTRILKFLYEEELYNVFLIHSIETHKEDVGELYLQEENNNVICVLYLKYDGNAYFTSFYCCDEKLLIEIGKQLVKIKHKGILLSGKRNEVSKILTCMGKNINSIPDIYYKYDINQYLKPNTKSTINFRRAACSECDINIISNFLIGFFEATSDQAINDITNREKILEKIKTGVYFIEYDCITIGMARISGMTKNYVDITTVYIDPLYRGKDFGKMLMEQIVQMVISENKTPVIQTSSINTNARIIYESIGFIKVADFSFEFIS